MLADLLGARLVQVEALTEAQRLEADRAAARLRWIDLPDARPLELRTEPLCPGLPEELKTPALWALRPLWWFAPDGAGRSLVGRWLAARGLALHIDVDTWEEALPLLPASGFVFVELHRPAPRAVPVPGLALCVAAPFEAPDPAFARVTSESPASFLTPLVTWVAARLPADGRFEPVPTLTWLERQIAIGCCRTLGDALSLCGVVDRLGVRAVDRATPAKLARSVIRSLVEAELGRGVHDVSWLLEGAFPLLVGLARRTLAERDETLFAARTFEQWLDLIPIEYRRGGDLDWLKLSLSDPNSPVRPSDVDKVARKLPPGGFKALRGLLALQILRPTGRDHGLSLGPYWLVRTLLSEARRALLDGSPLEWGEALLEPERSSELMTELSARARRDPAPLVEAVLELAGEDVAAVAALEAVFRAVGLAMLEGADVAPDQLEPLWDEQQRLLLRTNALPLPRIGYPAAAVSSAPELGPPAFYLAALAISEQSTQRSVGHDVLFPWRETAPPPALRALYDVVATLFDTPDPPSFAWPALALVDRLRALLGSVALDGGAPHALERAGIVLDEIEHGVLGWGGLTELGREPHGFAMLLWLSERRRLDPARIASAAWAAWLAEPATTPLGLLTPDSEAQRRLWRELPAEATARAARALAAGGRSLPIESFEAHHWTALLAGYSQLTTLRTDHGHPLARAPLGHIARALDAVRGEDVLIDDLWLYNPSAIAAHVSKLCGTSPERAVRRLLRARRAEAPVAGVLQSLAAVSLPPALQDELRSWLYRAISRREPVWREAYALLAAVERDLGPH